MFLFKDSTKQSSALIRVQKLQECQSVPLTSDKKKSYDTNCVPNPAEVESAPTKIAGRVGEFRK